ncbi:hypothetical protein [uncultured Aquabacterium sp.]|uniref:hypothetical protein n=1 Tax=Aquabacterium sp. TaxID=1872578 RepID=UPI0025CDA27D|nr:hypothetical protein [uncultured Aquabacterium sp.]
MKTLFAIAPLAIALSFVGQEGEPRSAQGAAQAAARTDLAHAVRTPAHRTPPQLLGTVAHGDRLPAMPLSTVLDTPHRR